MESVTALIPDVIQVHQSGMSASDWTAIFALVVSIATLVWQWLDRRYDRKEQAKLRKKEDALRLWNANYPHRLRFYTEFYDTLFRFVNYRGSIREKLENSGTETRIEIKIRPMDILDFCNTFNRLDEEAKMLFGKEISKPVHTIYTMVKQFVDAHNIQDLSMIIENSRDRTQPGNNFNARLIALQKDLQEEKMNSQLRDFFASVLTFPTTKKDSNNE